MDHSNDTDGIGAAFAFLTAAPFVIAIVFWVLCVVVTWTVAPEDRRWTFVGITLFFLGPLGVAAAAIAQPREARAPAPLPVAKGRRRFTCDRCHARNDIRENDTAYDCWQCSEHRTVKPANT